MDYDFIKDHALRNVWCAPNQDNQFIVEPRRLTQRHGDIRTSFVLWKQLDLPDKFSRWHVYQIGGIHPLAFNLFVHTYQWVSFEQACNEQKMIANVYTATGIQYPLHDTFYRYTEDRNLVIAVKLNAKIPANLNYEQIYMRVYTNAFFNSVRSNSIGQEIFVKGDILETNADKTNMKDQWDIYRQLSGHTHLIVNGVHHNDWVDVEIKIGDSVEVIYDASVKKVVEFRVGDCPVFESRLDDLRKILLHYSGTDPGMIDYQDDIDVIIERKINDTTRRGIYYHKNTPAGMRNLTHRDYSLPATYIRRFVDTFELMKIPREYYEPNDFYVKLYIRHSGYQRPLVFENNRIHELYKMQDADVVRAMVGIDATVVNWQAATLEESMYTKIMRSPCSEVTNPVAEQAYGYNAIAKYIADTPSRTQDENNRKVVDVPYKLMYGCTAYEYDVDGHLIGWHHHYVGPKYYCQSNDAEYVELIAGIGGNILDETYGASVAPMKKKNTYRVYMCQAFGGVPNNAFEDVTGDNTKYTVQNEVFTWIDPAPTHYPMIRSDARFLAIDMQLQMLEGQLKFTLQHMQSRNGEIKKWNMQIPMGQIDLFLNDRPLIRGLDYIVKFPEVYIISKRYLKTPLTEPQKVHLRFVGFCRPNGDLQPEGDLGFVEHGTLSNNNRFDIRDDKVLRIVVDGALKTREDLIFSELHSGVSIINALNGSPYMVKDVLVPVKSNTTTDTYILRNNSLAIDKAVSDYLTLKIPQPPRPAPSAITNRYQLFSPFCCKLIIDLKMGRLRVPHKATGLTRQEVIEICKSYEYLLAFDPTQDENKQDPRYVVIHPHSFNHVVDLPQFEYQFMHQVVQEYTNGLVTLSPSIRMINNP